jgi:alpha-L-fucosidase
MPFLPYEQRIRWFHEARFGLFVHWGLYSVLERGEWVMFRERIPAAEYQKLADTFTGEAFDADAIARLAVDAGMRYAVLTTRHHDGFCLWDTAVTDYNSVATGAKRDFVREYVEACRRHGLRVGLYLSNKDWREPGYWEPEKHPESAKRLVDNLHAMVDELLTDYGKIDLLWFDGSWVDVGRKEVDQPAFWRSTQLLDHIYELQPEILVNNRLGLDADLDTPEQHVTASEAGRGWEACMTIGDESAWGYCRHNPVRKTLGQLLRNLSKAACGEGNFLLNIGPDGRGAIVPDDAAVLKRMGEWLRVHGEAIYGSKRFALDRTRYSQGRCSRNGNTLYLHVNWWSSPNIVVPLFSALPTQATLLTTGQQLTVTGAPNGRMVIGGLPYESPHEAMTIIKLEFDTEPQLLDESDHAAWLTGQA